MENLVENNANENTEPTATAETMDTKPQKLHENPDEVQESAAESPESESTEESMEELMSMYEESFKRFAEGEVVTGRIISVDKDHVLVDIGYKSQGQIRIREFEVDGEVTAKVGDTVSYGDEGDRREFEVLEISPAIA